VRGRSHSEGKARGLEQGWVDVLCGFGMTRRAEGSHNLWGKVCVQERGGGGEGHSGSGRERVLYVGKVCVCEKGGGGHCPLHPLMKIDPSLVVTVAGRLVVTVAGC
jgi:hypothetical protein